MRMMTVIMKPVPRARAISLSRFFSIAMWAEYCVEVRSSEVIRRMMAMTASQRLMSDVERGKSNFLAF